MPVMTIPSPNAARHQHKEQDQLPYDETDRHDKDADVPGMARDGLGGAAPVKRIAGYQIEQVSISPAVLRAAEIEADAVLMAKNIDAIYSAAPKKDPNAVRYSQLTYAEVLEKNLRATDITAMALAMDNNMTMVCFGLAEENSIIRVVQGEQVGTTVTN